MALILLRREPFVSIIIGMKPFLHKVYRLMAEERMTYQEACREMGRRSAVKRKAIKHAKAMRSFPVPMDRQYPG